MIGLFGSWVLASAADAAQLQFWRFNADENRLTFTTDEGVQPRAQLISNPTRIVIDLPGVTFDRSTSTQAVGGAIREVRVGQFDAQTTRLVIELNAGYTIDPQQVRVQGSTPTQWLVQLPSPQRTGTSTPSPAPTPAPTPALTPSPTPSLSPAPSPTPSPSAVIPGAATRLDRLRITPDGLFFETDGATPEIEVRERRRRRHRKKLYIELNNTALSTQFTQTDVELNQFGVERLTVEQLEVDEDEDPVVQIILEREDRDQNWQVTASNLGGVVLIPTGDVAVRPPSTIDNSDRGDRDDRPTAPTNEPITIEEIQLTNNNTQLQIEADGAIATYNSGWDRATTDYQIIIPNARLARNVEQPDLVQGGPVLRLRAYEDGNSVVVSFLPASGTQLGGIRQPRQQTLAINVRQTGASFPGLPTPPGTIPDGSISLPEVRNSRVVLVIDPGHGGRDPGAVGINDLYEKHVVLPVSLEVAALLRQQGVDVVMTRSTDRELDLEPRVQIAERADADLFVSIHANAISLSRPDVNGIETYYYSNDGLQLARYIHNSLLQATGRPDRGVRQARFYVIRRTSMPAVLLEIGFVTGAEDAPLLATDSYRSLTAQAIARGILQYLQQQ
ncbi:MAG: N-acetylmuramoyl-L-alanine amidase [Merismopedia sp. SIO2A8]|nr:N-acetylmuramoyl-L-alanine amidase [Merismopedia sp. SIO2A8]